jgi:predicted dinucleotide-binding enzyme
VQIGIIGAGRIGGNAARLFGAAGHEVLLSFARDEAKLADLAAEIGQAARATTVTQAAAAPVVLLSVPWGVVDEALAQAGALDGRIIIDTTNQFGPGGVVDLGPGGTAAQFNAAKAPRARWTKSFNTLTSAFQAQAAGRTGPDRVVLFLCGDDATAKQTVSALIDDAGFAPVDLGGLADASVMEAPRRAGAVYGEEYHLDDGLAVQAAVRKGEPIPPVPHY